MDFLQNYEADENDAHVEDACANCGEPDDTLELVGENVDAAWWCHGCIADEINRAYTQELYEEEMRSLKGYYDSERERI